MGIRSYGVMGVDWEERANFERLRTERLARAKAGLDRSELGALLCFDMNNIRYITATHIGTWAVDKYVRFCLLPQGDEPDHVGLRLRRPPPQDLLPVARRDARARASRRCAAPCKGRAEEVAEKIRVELESAACSTSRSASTSSSCPCCSRSRRRASRSSTARR